MDILILVLGVVVLIGVVVLAFLFGFRKPSEDDPTKAKIPDHMKTGISWEDPDRYMGAKQKRRRRERGQDDWVIGQITKFFKPRS